MNKKPNLRRCVNDKCRSCIYDPKLPPGTNYCKCAACGEYFGGVSAFDLHRVGAAGDRSCLHPSQVSNRRSESVLRLNDKGYWVSEYSKTRVAA